MDAHPAVEQLVVCSVDLIKDMIRRDFDGVTFETFRRWNEALQGVIELYPQLRPAFSTQLEQPYDA